MKTPLQLMIYGKDIGNSEVSSLNKNMLIKYVHKTESPNYLFIDIILTPKATAGDYVLEFKNGNQLFRYTYVIKKREAESAFRPGFSASDMIYLIMPDRFSNGDSTNDSDPSTLEKANRSLDRGRHGGDIQGIINHLDYLQKLGVTAIWNTPLLLDDEEKSSYHGYACADYYQIDPRYGTNDLFRKLVTEAHQQGIKIIMDFVPNHCGTAHWWMKDLPFVSWLNPKGKRVRSFHAIGALTDVNGSQMDRNDVVYTWFSNSMPDMNLENPFVLHYFKQLAVWWIEWSGLDGLRIDTYPYLEKNNMSSLVQSIRNEYPHFNIVGECWRSQPSLVAYWQENQHVSTDGFNSCLPSVMDFPLSSALSGSNCVFNDRLMQIYESISQDFLYTNLNNLLIFADNHDKTRIATDITDIRELKLIITMLATLRGIPQLYYGTETGMTGARSKKFGDAQRQDFPGGWENDTTNNFKKIENELFDYTSRLFNWRKTTEVIHKGKTLHFKPNNGVYVYFRYTDEQCIMVAINGNDEPAYLEWDQYREITDKLNAGQQVLSGEIICPEGYLLVKGKEAIIIDFNVK